ncbi:MAG TPA: hypothetical protein VFF73_09945, partial [Planctomycetota bacterium]|nr:hypothetical protein [Planctomycetota bacterium]
VLLDDNITSGIQLKQYLSEMFPDHSGVREHLSEPLQPEQLDQLQKTRIYALVGVELGGGRSVVEAFARDKGLCLAVHSGSQDSNYWLEYGGRAWESAEDATAAKALIANISRSLFQDKGWTEDKVAGRLLGYGNLQKLTVFAHNTPACTRPARPYNSSAPPLA